MNIGSAFATLVSSGVPALLAAAVDAVTAAAGLNGSIGFAFKDSSGNVILPTLNPDGTIPTSPDAGTPDGIAGNASGNKVTEQEICKKVLALSKQYNSFKFSGACHADSLYRLIYVDDVGVTDTEVDLGYIKIGAGDNTESICLGKREIDTTAGTGVQELQLRAININQLDDMYGEFSYNEKP